MLSEYCARFAKSAVGIGWIVYVKIMAWNLSVITDERGERVSEWTRWTISGFGKPHMKLSEFVAKLLCFSL